MNISNLIRNGFDKLDGILIFKILLTFLNAKMVKRSNTVEKGIELIRIVGLNEFFAVLLVLCEYGSNRTLGLKKVLLKIDHMNQIELYVSFNNYL